jgi:hypothetical protein
MELKKGAMYTAVSKKDINKVMTIITEFGKKKTDNWFYARVIETTFNTYDHTYFHFEEWLFYEHSKQGDYTRNEADILAAKALALELDCKSLFDSYSRDLKFLKMGEKVG